MNLHSSHNPPAAKQVTSVEDDKNYQSPEEDERDLFRVRVSPRFSDSRRAFYLFHNSYWNILDEGELYLRVYGNR